MAHPKVERVTYGAPKRRHFFCLGGRKIAYMSWDKPYSRHPDRQTCGRRRRQYPWRPIYCSKVGPYTAAFGIKLKKWAGNNYEDGDEENKDLTFKKGEEPYGQELGL